MSKAMPIGVDDFKEVITKNYYFVDKTEFIRQIIDKHSKVTLITRPRRFGKTLTMSMLDYFFSNSKSPETRQLFCGLNIERAGEKYMKEQGQYPVIFLSLKDIKNPSWQDWPRMLQFIRLYLSQLYANYRYLAHSPCIDDAQSRIFDHIDHQTATEDEMAMSLANLMAMVQQYYQKPVILLIDEYDVPIQQAWESGYYQGCIGFMRQFLGAALKTNPSLNFAILTGVLRVAKESIFSGLNNLDVCTVMNNTYAEIFGFTPSEVTSMAKDQHMEYTLPDLKRWYDGYHFGDKEIYNPWSIVNFFKYNSLEDYWLNTSGNGIIQHMMQNIDAEKEESLLSLLHGKSIPVTILEGIIYDDIDEDEDALYTMLLTTGYLTAIDKEYDIGGWTVDAIIPNREIQDVFRLEIINRFRAKLSTTRLKKMLRSLLTGKTEDFSNILATYIRYLVSSYDAANKESFYHGFLLGMTALFVPDYIVESNRESGYGRFDLAIFPKDITKSGVILEFKAADSEEHLQTKAEEALQQIESRKYITAFEKRGIHQVWKYGIAFYQKQVCVVRNDE